MNNLVPLLRLLSGMRKLSVDLGIYTLQALSLTFHYRTPRENPQCGSEYVNGFNETRPNHRFSSSKEFPREPPCCLDLSHV